MSRKDNKNRVLEKGESQRKDGTYMYRYNNHEGIRKSVYAKTLNELRKKEKQILKDLEENMHSYDKDTTVSQLLDLYMDQKRNLKPSSAGKYAYMVNVLKESSLGQKKIGQVKFIDAKSFFLELYDKGYRKGSIQDYACILKPAFQMAFECEMIRVNPFNISLKFLPDNTNHRYALTSEEEESFLEFLRNNSRPKTKELYDMAVVLFETGLRASEFASLTVKDIDLENRKLSVKNNMYVDTDYTIHLTTTKSKQGERDIYISNKAYVAFQNLLERRKKFPEITIDGKSGFLLLSDTKNGILHGAILCYKFNAASRRKQKEDPDFPKVTPHICRHTFCTRMVEKGVDPKTIQSIMGHSDIKMTMGTYTHFSKDTAVKNMRLLLEE